MRRTVGRITGALGLVLLAVTAGCGGGGGGRGLSADKVPPSFAGLSSATAVHDTRLFLEWAPGNDARTPASQLVYHIYLATAPGAQDFLNPTATTGLGEVVFLLDGLAAGTTYYIVVRAEDLAGNEDSNGVEVAATTLLFPDTMPPTFGGASTATPLTSFSIEVTWAAATDDNTPAGQIVYHAYASTTPGGQGFGLPDATSAPGDTTVTVGSLQPTTTYHIVVRAEDLANNEDANVVEVSATTLTPDLTPPVFSGVQTASPASTRVDLGWIAATDNQASPAQIVYQVFWALTPGGQNFLNPNAITGPGATTYQAQGLTPNTDYYFVVRASDPSGNVEQNTVELRSRTLVSFNANVLGIFTGNCAVQNCHGQTNPVLGQNLTSWSTIFNTAINQPAQQPNNPPMDRIEPGQSSLSYLMHKVDGTHLGVGGSGDQMPKNNPPLPQASREILRDWIDQGAQNN